MSLIEPLEKRLARYDRDLMFTQRSWHSDAWGRLWEFEIYTAGTRNADAFLKRTSSGAVTFCGPEDAGKSYRLLKHFLPSKHYEPNVGSGRRGVRFKVDNLRTASTLAFGICTALSSGGVDYTLWEEEAITAEACRLARKFRRPLAIDDFPDIRTAGVVVDPGLDDFLFELAATCPLILAGRAEELSDTLRQMPRLKGSIVAEHFLEPVGRAEALRILEEYEAAASVSKRRFLTSKKTADWIVDRMTARTVGEWRRFVTDIYRVAFDADTNVLTQEHVEYAWKSQLFPHVVLPTVSDSLTVKIDEVLITNEDPCYHGDPRRDLCPRDGIWRLPIKASHSVPVVEDDRITPAFTIREAYGRLEWVREVCMDAKTGTLYGTFKAEKPADEVAAHVFEAAERLFLNELDPPEALVGFPFGARTRHEAQEALAQNVARFLPRFFSQVIVTSASRVCIREDSQPYMHVDFQNGVVRARIRSDIDDLSKKAMSFDYDDVDTVLTFANSIKAVTKFDICDIFAEYSDTVIEHVPDAIRRDAFARFMNDLAGYLHVAARGSDPPKHVSGAIIQLYAVTNDPDEAEGEALLEALRAIKRHFGMNKLRVDGFGRVSLLDIAICRTYASMGYVIGG